MHVVETYLVTHAGCLDGVGCALVFLTFGGKRENIITISPSATKSVVPNNDSDFYIFADVAPRSKEEIEFWSRRGNVYVYDHHESSKNMRDLDWCRIDDTACGSLLFYHNTLDIYAKTSLQRTPYEGELFSTVSLIDDFDRWQNKDSRSDDLSLYMKIVGFDECINQIRESANDVRTVLKKNKDLIDVLKKSRDAYVEKLLKRFIVVKAGSDEIGCVIASDHVSFLLNKFLTLNPDVQFAAAFDFTNMCVSLRSIDDKNNCSDFCRQFDGGGHKRAAGFKIERSTIVDVIESVFPQ